MGVSLRQIGSLPASHKHMFVPRDIHGPSEELIVGCVSVVVRWIAHDVGAFN